jgi:hypothetical protein
MDPGDYVNIKFEHSLGFLIVSGPSGEYYVNVASGCDSATDLQCHWRHTTRTGGYFVMGGSDALAQVTAITSGIFQLTVGYFRGGCCESVMAFANETRTVQSWGVTGGAAACFVHTARTGTLRLSDLVLGDSQTIRTYNFNSFRERIETNGVVPENAGIGAFMLDNRESRGMFSFGFRVDLTDPDDVGYNLDYITWQATASVYIPSVFLGEAWDFAHFLMREGGCVGTVCSEEASEQRGNTGGTPSKSAGDPIYEDGTTAATMMRIIVLVTSVTIAGSFFVACCVRFYRRPEPASGVAPRLPEDGAYGPVPLSTVEIVDPYAIVNPDPKPCPDTPVDPYGQPNIYGGAPISFPVRGWESDMPAFSPPSDG